MNNSFINSGHFYITSSSPLLLNANVKRWSGKLGDPFWIWGGR